jgi:hypothetical protein
MLSALLDWIEAEREDEPRHPRPWDLANLPDHLEPPVWQWLGEAVEWLEACHGWQPERAVPRCWAKHPHLAVELAALLFAREIAFRCSSPAELLSWHADLDQFLRKMPETVGATSLRDCHRNKHRRPASERPV